MGDLDLRIGRFQIRSDVDKGLSLGCAFLYLVKLYWIRIWWDGGS